MSISIGLIDYGMGNLHSVRHSFKRLKHSLKEVKGPNDLNDCQALILPGVGSFDPAMENLRKTNLIPELKKWDSENKPLLGICLGLQLLFEASDEGNLEGLGLLKGKIKHLPTCQNERIPHIGWAQLKQKKECPLLADKGNMQWMYFVHSFSAIASHEKDVAATVDFGNEEITSIVWRKNLAACQFHPEKSGKSGEELLSCWLSWLNSNTHHFH